MTWMHKIRIEADKFQAICTGTLTYLVLKNDRNFKVGNVLLLEAPGSSDLADHSIRATAVYITYGGNYGIDIKYCVIGFIINRVNVPVSEESAG